MKKAQLPLNAELDLGDPENSTSKSKETFAGTDNARHLRVLQALADHPRRRAEIDRVGGVSNGPDLIADLRRLGLDIPCRLIPGIDRDGFPVRYGVYSLTVDDCGKLLTWMRAGSSDAVGGGVPVPGVSVEVTP